MPKVTINGGIFVLAIIIPLTRPANDPTIIPANIGTITGYIPGCAKLATTTDVSPTIDPGERSMPPDIITNVLPKAIIAMIEICLTTLVKFVKLRKPGYRIVVITTIRSNINNVPYLSLSLCNLSLNDN
jgi:hypothetical protein